MRHLLVDNLEHAVGVPGPRGEFARGALTDRWLRQRLLSPGRLLDVLMRGGVGLPQLRCLRDGADLHPNAYTTTHSSRRGAGITIVDMRRLAQLLREGVTLVADSLDAVDPVLEVACRALRWWTEETVRVNAYLTTGATAGFPLHWDDHDVIVVQLDGTKTWEVRGTSRPAPMFRDAARNDTAPEEVLWAGELRAGEVLYIPRGHWHHARCLGGHSLHLTFGLTRRTGVDWLRWVADHSRELDAFREDLPRDWEPGGLADATSELVADRPVARMLADLELTAPPARHVITHGLFDGPQAVVCVTDRRPRVNVVADTVVVEGAGKRLTFTGGALPALRLLLSGAPVVVADVAEIDTETLEQVAAVLVREELCAEMTKSLWSGYIGLVQHPRSSTML